MSRIFIDADSCPKRIRAVVRKAAGRTRVAAIFVANRTIPDIKGTACEMRVVADADAEILECSRPDDLVITRDIPLAAELVASEVLVLNDRGTVYTSENVRERLSLRDFMSDLRERGTLVPENDQFSDRDLRSFSAAFDRELTRLLRKNKK